VDYTFNRLLTGASFDEVDARTRKALAANGNPKMAHQAIGMEPRVGAMLPCNVILREVDGGVEVSAIDPVASMQAIDNPALHAVAGQVRDLLAKAVEAI
jgi:uncharacterized protein (DUF302 family)